MTTAAKCAAVVCALLTTACESELADCGPIDDERLALLPQRLSETGLYADIADGTLAPDVLTFRPRFELWSDGAAKQRWIRLPPLASIDSRDMNSWIFPEGTRLWKQFTRDGVRVETRLLHKLGPGDDDWASVAYIWQPDQRDAVMSPDGEVDVLGTAHDVPASPQCRACHGGRRSHVLGFSAIQLAHDDDAQGVTLDVLAERGLISRVPDAALQVPGDEVERAALGYLHANCGHCHNSAHPRSGGARCFDPQNDLDFWLRADALSSPEATPTYLSGHERGCIEPGEPRRSRMVRLMARRGDNQMPPLASERVDESALELVERWIAAM